MPPDTIIIPLLRQLYENPSLVRFACLHADGRERLQGELMVSRAVGDLSYRKYGLIAEPEFAPWRSLTSGKLNHNQTYMFDTDKNTLVPISLQPKIY